MQDVHEIAAQITKEINISASKAKAVIRFLRAKGLMPQGDSVEDLTKIKQCLGRNHHLSLAQLMRLIDAPNLIKALGAKAPDARKQISRLADPVKNAAPSAIAAFAMGAANHDRDALERFKHWVCETIPPAGCTYHYLALRIIYGAHENFRPSLIRRMQFAMLVLRSVPEFEAWFTVKINKGRSETFYHRPKISL